MKNKKSKNRQPVSPANRSNGYGIKYPNTGAIRTDVSHVGRKKDHTVLVVVIFVLTLGFIGALSSRVHHVSAGTTEIEAGGGNLCLNLETNAKTTTSFVDINGCDGSVGESWVVSQSLIKHDDSGCLGVVSDDTADYSKVGLSTCASSPGQIWLNDKGGFYNPNSGLCLDAPNYKSGKQLEVDSCSNLSEQSNAWLAATVDSHGKPVAYGNNCNSGTEGQRVACYAEMQWTIWQSGSPSHEALLNNYSDGNGYEEWCADFVSYIYKEAGYSFTQGERNGWDEYLAANIQNNNFTIHQAEGYTPQTGDVAFFNYSGGHVEIVASGGSTPTFVYGDSGTVDPSTGNGDMEANTITSNGSNGQVIYYLTPN